MQKIEYLVTKEKLEHNLRNIDKLFIPAYIRKMEQSEDWKKYYFALNLIRHSGRFIPQKYPNEAVETIIFDGMEFNRPVFYKQGEGPIRSREEMLEKIDKLLNKKRGKTTGKRFE
ncbi:MAG: hypothetical protein EOO46_25495 [Flavobacterium sp.]|nr:MAG: hypothetical protein EOO46_25495 [Flavobacterium sp.]